MSYIRMPVGRVTSATFVNVPDDVRIVQRLLNSQLGKLTPLAPLLEDGRMGPATIGMIEEFQRRVVGMRRPDGRVDPLGPTFMALANGRVAAPARVSVTNAPVALDPAEVAKLADPKSRLTIGGIWGEAKAGDTWLGNDGERLILSASYLGVIFFLKPRGKTPAAGLYIQSAEGFIGEVTTYPLAEAGRRAGPMARLAELEIQLIIGIAAASSGMVFLAVVGTDAVKFIAENRDNFGKWSRTFSVLLALRSTLKQYAPTLNDKLFDAALFDVLRNSPQAINGDSAARLVGAIIAKLGKQAVSARFSVLSALWTIALQVATKCLTAMPKAISITMGEYKESADKIIEGLKSIGVTISKDEAQKIFDEIRKRPKEIMDALKKAVDSLK